MSGALQRSRLTTCGDMNSATSSPELADGLPPCGSRGGPMTDLFGPAPAPVSPSAKPGDGKPSTTSATCGRHGAISSESAVLQRSLENRLRQAMGSNGPTEQPLILKPKAMPSGRPYSRLMLRALRTDETDFTLLPTPSAQTQEGGLRIDGGSRSRAKWKALGLSKLGTAASIAMAGWLMGYRETWQSLSPAVSVMRSSRNSPQPS